MVIAAYMLAERLATFRFRKVVGTKVVFEKKKDRGQPELNRRPLDLQSNALPLSYTPKADERDVQRLIYVRIQVIKIKSFTS